MSSPLTEARERLTQAASLQHNEVLTWQQASAVLKQLDYATDLVAGIRAAVARIDIHSTTASLGRLLGDLADLIEKETR